MKLIDRYPDFRKMYEQVYYICQNIEGVMDMFSEELRMLDRNTVKYMIDEMQNDLEQKTVQIGEAIAEKETIMAELLKAKKRIVELENVKAK